MHPSTRLILHVGSQSDRNLDVESNVLVDCERTTRPIFDGKPTLKAQFKDRIWQNEVRYRSRLLRIQQTPPPFRDFRIVVMRKPRVIK
ncbi:hypothetical protein Y032_0027g1603 [Ancylostoma ceylanicum]|nr:hypothetical protein Y032_0027g1603 [Ancylostoma ceylanicum]